LIGHALNIYRLGSRHFVRIALVPTQTSGYSALD
jgi:hypothetical protein